MAFSISAVARVSSVVIAISLLPSSALYCWLITPHIRVARATHWYDQVREAFTGTGVSWGPYQTFRQLVDDDPRVATDSEMWEEVEHPGVGRYRMPGTPLDFSAIPRTPVQRAPALGEHTAEVLNDVLGLSDAEIGRLADDGVVALG